MCLNVKTVLEGFIIIKIIYKKITDCLPFLTGERSEMVQDRLPLIVGSALGGLAFMVIAAIAILAIVFKRWVFCFHPRKDIVASTQNYSQLREFSMILESCFQTGIPLCPSTLIGRDGLLFFPILLYIYHLQSYVLHKIIWNPDMVCVGKKAYHSFLTSYSDLEITGET